MKLPNRTYPGINRAVKTKILSPEENQIIENISRKYWYVTRIESHTFGESLYNVAFLKPIEYITQNFNLSREVVLILSNYQSFEARALDVLDNLDAQTLRIEEVCCLVASKDSHVETVISSLLKSNNESRIIVPFTYDELLGDDCDRVIDSKMRMHFFSRDLFGIQNALKSDIYFFGRRDLIQDLVSRHENGENAGIFGLRKTGKTSILYGVARTLTRKTSLSVYIDCQILHNQPWNIALLTIIRKIVAEGQLKQDICKRNNEIYLDESRAPYAFENDIQAIVQIYLKKNILLIFDEVENITFGASMSESWRSGQSFIKFWQVIRSVYQSQKGHRIFTFLIAGTNPRCIEVPSVDKTDNPIFSLFQPYYIEPFNYDQTKEMLDRLGGYMGIIFTSEVIAHIQEDFGGHPLLIRQICSLIHRQHLINRPVEIGKHEYTECKKNFYKDNAGFSKYAQMILQVLCDWYPDEYEMLKWLAVDDFDNFNELALDTTYIQHLKSYQIIGEDSTDHKYHFRIEALKEYLARQNKYLRPLSSNDDRVREINERRSIIERKLRKLLRRQLKSSLGEEKAKAEMIREIYGQKEIGHKSNQPYADFFDPDKHEVYLTTLFKVIERNYCVFQNLFDIKRELFNSKWQLLNEYRHVDAHTKKISNSDFDIFRGIASWFEEKLSEE